MAATWQTIFRAAELRKGVGGRPARRRGGETRDASAAAPESGAKKRYAVVGVGSRAYVYLDAIQTTHAATAELVAVCDTNAGRIELARAHASKAGRAEPRYGDFVFLTVMSGGRP